MAIPTRPRRRLLWILLGILGVLLIGVALAPRLVGASLVKGLAARKLGSPVELEGASFSWFGSQRLEGLRVGAPAGGGAEPAPLLRVGSVTVKQGLLGLLGSRSRLEVEVESPRIFLHRDSAGRFNFEELFRRAVREPRSGEPAPRPRPGPGEDPPRPLPPARLPLELSLHVRGGELEVLDEVLGTRASVANAVLDLEGGDAGLSARAAATSGQTGRFELQVSAGEAAGGAPDPLELHLVLQGLDLKPYRGVLERVAGITPPEEAISATLDATLKQNLVRVEGSLAAGFLRVESATLSLPVGAEGNLDLALPFSLDLAPARTVLAGRLPELAAAELQGLVKGTVHVAARTHLEDLLRHSGALADALSGRAAKVEARLEANGLRVRWPRSGRVHALEEQALRAVITLEPGGDAEPRVAAEIVAQGLSSTLSAALPGKGAPPGDAALSLDASVLSLLKLAGIESTDQLEVAPGARLRVKDLQIAGLRLWQGESGGPSFSELSQSGRVELGGGEIRAGGVRLGDGSALLRAMGGIVVCSDVKLAASGGEVSAPQLVLDLRESEPSARGSLRVEGVAASYELAALLAYVLPFLALEDRQGALEGTISATLDLAGRGTTRDALEKTLKGSGALRIRQGKLTGSKLFGEAGRLLGSGLGEVLFAETGSDFLIGDGKITASKAFLTGREGGQLRNLGLAGTVGLDRNLDLGVDLEAIQETVGDRKIQVILREARKVLGNQGFPLRLRGTLDDPKLSLEASLDSLPGLDRILDEVLKPASGGQEAKPEEPGLNDLLELFKKKKKKKK